MTMGLEDTKKVNSCRARRNMHKLFIRKKDFYYESGQILEEVIQRGCNLFSLGNVQEPNAHVSV